MSITRVSPQAAAKLLEQDAVLVDIRAGDEYARCHIAQALSVPFEQLNQQQAQFKQAPTVIFHCRSGNRTELNSAALAAAAGESCYVLEGGLEAWQRAGLPIVEDRSQPLELMRQVQIAAGSLVLLGVLLGTLLAPVWYALAAFVGAGLIFAGVSGFCGMAKLLMLMPWNRPRA